MQKKIFVEIAQLKKQSQVTALFVYITYEALVVLIKYAVEPIVLFWLFVCLFSSFFFFPIRNQIYS